MTSCKPVATPIYPIYPTFAVGDTTMEYIGIAPIDESFFTHIIAHYVLESQRVVTLTKVGVLGKLKVSGGLRDMT